MDRVNLPNANLSQWALDHMADRMRAHYYTEEEIKREIDRLRPVFKTMGAVTLATKVLSELHPEHYLLP